MLLKCNTLSHFFFTRNCRWGKDCGKKPLLMAGPFARCCRVLQRVAVCCGVLQRVAVCCSAFYWIFLTTAAHSRSLYKVLQCVVVCCSVLQCVAVCCSVLQCVAVWCSVLQCVAARCSELLCVTVHCSVLLCVAVCCSALQCAAMCCNMLQCAAVCCNVLQCVAICCSVLQCVAVCSVILCIVCIHCRSHSVDSAHTQCMNIHHFHINTHSIYTLPAFWASNIAVGCQRRLCIHIQHVDINRQWVYTGCVCIQYIHSSVHELESRTEIEWTHFFCFIKNTLSPPHTHTQTQSFEVSSLASMLALLYHSMIECVIYIYTYVVLKCECLDFGCIFEKNCCEKFGILGLEILGFEILCFFS